MPKLFDATLKDLGREHPRDFVSTFDQSPTLPLSLLNVDLSTVTTAADLVVGLGNPLQEIIQIDFQASASATKHTDVLVYNALLFAHYRVPVHSILLLLRPQAAHYNLNGVISYAPRPQRGKMEFGYEVVRLWERPVEELLAGDLGILPLATLGKMPAQIPQEQALADTIQKLVDRLIQDAPPERINKLLTAAFLLTGLRIKRDLAYQLFQGVRAMHESDTYMAIIDEGRDLGREEEAKRLIFIQGEECFGQPDEATRARINSISDIDQLEALAKRLIKVASWQELLE